MSIRWCRVAPLVPLLSPRLSSLIAASAMVARIFSAAAR
jgi:hypothetical protein